MTMRVGKSDNMVGKSRNGREDWFATSSIITVCLARARPFHEEIASEFPPEQKEKVSKPHLHRNSQQPHWPQLVQLSL